MVVVVVVVIAIFSSLFGIDRNRANAHLMWQLECFNRQQQNQDEEEGENNPKIEM